MSKHPPIPVRNIYYLLAYAFDLPEGERFDVDPTSCPDAKNLLALLLARSIRNLAKRGFERNYHSFEEESARVRGRILLAESYRHMLPQQGRMRFCYDELDPNCLTNQILRSTCDRLLRGWLKSFVKQELRQAQALLVEVQATRLTASSFARVRFHRNNRRYRFPIALCRLLFLGDMATESAGDIRHLEAIFSKRSMPMIFERFVRNFARAHIRNANKISDMYIEWQGTYDASPTGLVPKMITDVSIDHPDWKMILDCKFYRKALLRNRKGTKRFRSGHLYQLTSYLRNKSVDAGWETATGALLYPAVEEGVNEQFKLNGHPIHVLSIDLDQPWRNIARDLKALFKLHAQNGEERMRFPEENVDHAKLARTAHDL